MSRTAFIAIVGRPNVGKSTLLNHILGEKVAIVSKRPQTTRNRITGIHTVGEDQYVFLDTPGVHRPRTKLGDYMVKAASDTLGGADAALLVVEPRGAVGDIEGEILEKIKRAGIGAILVVNKTDSVTAENVAKTIAAYSAAFDFDAVVPTVAKSGKNVDVLLSECERYLTESAWFFPEEMITDQTERQIAAEIIREKLLKTLSDEVPHGVAVSIEEFTETGKLIRIRADIYCERTSHKGIIIGAHGETLKRVGSKSREDLEKFFGTKVFLDLWVKVKENWRDSQFNLNDLGYRKDE
ncbi:MAG: GTPase Era [Clostridia bacterium]|nr:GTPase Era [Clostridia bacterium]MDY6184821.1 GTPase Era [Eubacteriales bacterium]